MATNLIEIAPAPPDQRADWKALRKKFVGGSDSASMFNEGYGCKRRLWYDKTNVPPDYARSAQDQEVLERGTQLEDFVVFRFQQQTGLKVRVHKTSFHPRVAHMGVNLDRQIVGVTPDELARLFGEEYRDLGPTGALEAKTANEWAYKKIVEAKTLPPDYVLQMQHALAVKGYRWGVFAVLEVGSRLRDCWFPVMRNEALIEQIEGRVEQMWNEHIEPNIAPEPLETPDKRCKSCLWRRTCMGGRVLSFEEAGDKEIPVDDTLMELASDYAQARAIYEQDEETLETITNLIKQHIGDNVGALVPSAGVGFRWKFNRPGKRLDSKALEGVIRELRNTLPKPTDADYAERTEQPTVKFVQQMIAVLEACWKPSQPARPFVFLEL